MTRGSDFEGFTSRGFNAYLGSFEAYGANTSLFSVPVSEIPIYSMEFRTRAYWTAAPTMVLLTDYGWSPAVITYRGIRDAQTDYTTGTGAQAAAHYLVAEGGFAGFAPTDALTPVYTAAWTIIAFPSALDILTGFSGRFLKNADVDVSPVDKNFQLTFASSGGWPVFMFTGREWIDGIPSPSPPASARVIGGAVLDGTVGGLQHPRYMGSSGALNYDDVVGDASPTGLLRFAHSWRANMNSDP